MMQHLDGLCLDAYLDDTLSPEEKAAASRHLEACTSCRAQLENRRQLQTTLGSLPEVALPADFHDRLTAYLVTEKNKKIHRLASRRRIIPIVLSAAACFVLVVGGLTLALGGGFSGIAAGVGAIESGERSTASYSMKSAANLAAYGAGETARSGSTVYDPPAEAPMLEEPTDGYAYDVTEVFSEAGDMDEHFFASNDVLPDESTLLTPEEAQGQKLVYNCNIDAETTAFDRDTARMLRQCTDVGGYVESSSVSGKPFTEPNGYGRYASYTMRIPSSRYQESVSGIKNICSVTDFNEHVRNITYDYNNTQIQPENLKLQRNTLLELLDKAENLDDVVLLQSELNHLSTRIQQVESSVRSMDNEVDYAYVYVYVNEVEDASTLLKNREEKTFLQRMQEQLYINLAGIRDGFISFSIGFVAFLPVLILILLAAGLAVLVVLLIVRGIRKKRRKA